MDTSNHLQPTNIYISRHLQRVDDIKSNNKQQIIWDTQDSKNIEFKINPYLSDKAYEPYNIDKIINAFPACNIDIIITSPFLRCIQTSFILLDRINELKTINKLKLINKILVNFKLSEIVNECMFPIEKIPLNIQDIYDFSIKNIKTSNKLLDLYESTNCYIYDETDNDYYKRIKQAINEIKSQFPGKNILIVTHSDSGKIFINKDLSYLQIIKIPDDFMRKYLKYKNKYLNIK
jgi:broad specificity phosphatase PhoE